MRPIPWWALASAGAAPVLLVGGWTLADALQPPGYDPVRDTISALAALGATDRWVMTSALAGLGACHVVTALGLRPARPPRPGRLRRRGCRHGDGGGLPPARPRELPVPHRRRHGGIRRPGGVARTGGAPEPVAPAVAPGLAGRFGRAARTGGVVRGRAPRRPAWTGRARRGGRPGPVAVGGRRHHPPGSGPNLVDRDRVESVDRRQAGTLPRADPVASARSLSSSASSSWARRRTMTPISG